MTHHETWLQLGMFDPCDLDGEVQLIGEPMADIPENHRMFDWVITVFNERVGWEPNNFRALAVFPVDLEFGEPDTFAELAEEFLRKAKEAANGE